MSLPPRIALRGLTKRFPDCVANEGIDLEIARGEIHALLGENGAGKSTLVKMIYGVLQPDAGTIFWEGSPIQMTDPSRARQCGIGMVFQHFALFDSLTVAENIVLGVDIALSTKEISERLDEVREHYGLVLEPDRIVGDLSVGERQRVEIVRTLLQNPTLLIMDEPTSVLTPQEGLTLFDTLRRLALEGCTILYISHKLEEIRQLCERATILRNGRVVAQCIPNEESVSTLAKMMVGEDIARKQSTTRHTPSKRSLSPRLEVINLTSAPVNETSTALDEVNIKVHAGEIVGIAGMAGNGQSTLLACLSGELLTPAGMLRIDEKSIGGLGPRARRRHYGLAFVPEERLGQGAVADMSLAENALLTGYETRGLLQRGWIRFQRAREYAHEIIDHFGVVTVGPKSLAASLSGGNLQKYIIGRELLQTPKVLVVAHPTWGIDAAAAIVIHGALEEMAHSGTAILVVSQDLDELFTLCARIAVMSHGRLSPAMARDTLSRETVGRLLGEQNPNVLLAANHA